MQKINTVNIWWYFIVSTHKTTTTFQQLRSIEALVMYMSHHDPVFHASVLGCPNQLIGIWCWWHLLPGLSLGWCTWRPRAQASQGFLGFSTETRCGAGIQSIACLIIITIIISIVISIVIITNGIIIKMIRVRPAFCSKFSKPIILCVRLG